MVQSPTSTARSRMAEAILRASGLLWKDPFASETRTTPTNMPTNIKKNDVLDVFLLVLMILICFDSGSWHGF